VLPAEEGQKICLLCVRDFFRKELGDIFSILPCREVHVLWYFSSLLSLCNLSYALLDYTAMNFRNKIDFFMEDQEV